MFRNKLAGLLELVNYNHACITEELMDYPFVSILRTVYHKEYRKITSQ